MVIFFLVILELDSSSPYRKLNRKDFEQYEGE